MGSQTALKLPIIDLSNVDLEGSTPEWAAVRCQVYKVLKEYGCFEALFDQVPSELRKAIFAAHQELYDLPLETKQRPLNCKPYHGYHGHNLQNQILEALSIDHPDDYEKVESLTNVFWPQGNLNFNKTIQSFAKQLTELDQIIRKMISESLGVENYLEEHINSSYYILRMMKYTGPRTNDSKVGQVRHTDKNILTILCQNEVDGLEVETKEGEWIKHKPSSSHSFVVVAGDTLHAWLNGRVHAPPHLVKMSGNEIRYSCGLFSSTRDGLIVKAPDELVDEEHPLLFKPYVHSEFMKFLRTCGNINPLKAYCGV